jgi:hypothetical protein
MDYPGEFSAQARARVEAERVKAGKQLEQDMNRASRYGPGITQQQVLRQYILRVFRVFAHEACALGSE